MKLRFSSLDIQVITHELNATLPGHRLANVYDLSSRIFLLKFAKPDSKHQLLIDSGFRCHLTTFVRETASTPSSFVTKLRKILRTRRVSEVKQLGIDRIIQIVFGDRMFHLFLEFFAGGNVILTDAEFNILAVLRIVQAGEGGGAECKVGAKYNTSVKEPPGPITKEQVVKVLEDAVTAGKAAEEAADEPEKPKKGGKFQQKSKKKKKADMSIKRVLSVQFPQFPPALAESCFIGAGVDPGMKADEVLKDEGNIGKILAALQEGESVVANLLKEGEASGYIIAKLPNQPSRSPSEPKQTEKKGVSFGNTEAIEMDEPELPEKVQEEGEAKGLVYDDFHPFLPRQAVNTPGVKAIECKGFNKTVDKFFSSIEAQKLEGRLAEREAVANKRLEAAKTDHAKRVEGLRGVQELNIQKAEAIEANSARVEEAIAAVNGLISQGMDWGTMARLIEGEQRRGNAVAEVIQLPLKLYDNTITLKLRNAGWENDDNDSGYDDTTDADEESNEEEDENKPRFLSIDVDLSKTAFANARTYYEQRRSAIVKEVKTAQSSKNALKAAEKKIEADLKKSLKTEKQVLRPVRTPLWFEKFLFFLSSDGYLVLGSRDMMQSELLYKKYLKKGDIWVHADIQGATTIVVKNNPATPNAPIPPGTLQQAGTLSVATSKAWDTKAVMSGWWVNYNQVSKTAPKTGEYLPLGTFEIKGTKNFLPPAQLIMGFGVLWRVDDESKKRHVRHRVEQPEEKAEGSKPVDNEPAETNAEGEEATRESDADGDGDGKEGTSDDEEFPDAKIDSEDEDFPDARIESDDKKETKDDEASGGEKDAEELQEPMEDLAVDDPPPAAESKDEPARPDSSVSSATGNRHLSAKQRRDLKKGRPISEATTPSEPTTRSSTPLSTTTKQSADSQAKKSVPLPRGKRAKQKRIEQKYANQDEEERTVALAMLGSSTGARANAASVAEETAAKKETPEERKARLREQHKRAQAQGLAEEAKRQAALEEDDNDENEKDEIANTPLDAFIPDPRDDDVLLDAIPICAPFGAMGRFKWRVKMQPGAQKKGQAVRGVWNSWVAEKSKDGMKGKERDLVSGWRETEIVNCVGVGKVKVFGTAGGEKGKGGGGGGGKGKGKGKANSGKRK